MSPSPLAGGEVGLIKPANSEVGRAIRTTPTIDTKAAYCSIRVKGSLMKMEHAQQAKLGARKVMTVASASGRYRREKYMPKTPKNPPHPRAMRSHLISRLPKGKSGILEYHIYQELSTRVMDMRANSI